MRAINNRVGLTTGTEKNYDKMLARFASTSAFKFWAAVRGHDSTSHSLTKKRKSNQKEEGSRPGPTVGKIFLPLHINFKFSKYAT